MDHKENTIITESYWKHLETANRELALCLERLRKVRATGDVRGIREAEMAYFQALQWVYDMAVGAVASKQ